MASTYSDLKIELIGTGEQSGTWGITTDTNLGTALGEAITGSADVNFSSAADVTVTLTNTNTAQTARNLRLNLTESSTGVGYVGNLILGSDCQIEKLYLINNGTTGAKTIKNTTGTGITVPAGTSMFVFNNGTNVVDAITAITSGTINNTSIGATTPSTGAFTSVTDSGLTSGRVTYAGTAGLLQDSANLTFNGTTLTSTGFSGPISGVVTSTSITDSGLTSGRVTYAGTGGLLTDSANLTFDGTKLTAGNILDSGLTASQAVFSDASKNLVSNATTGTGNVVMSASPTLTGTIGAASQTLSGSLSVGTTLGVTGVASFADGSASAPAITNTSDTNNGIFFPAADATAITTSGTERMRVNSSGNVLVGQTGSYDPTNGTAYPITQISTTSTNGALGLFSWEPAATAPALRSGKSRGTTEGSYTIVQNADVLLSIGAYGADGAKFVQGASIQAWVDGTPGLNDMPTRLTFSTTADGGTTPAERMRIASNGFVMVGTTTTPSNSLFYVAGSSGFGIDSSGASENNNQNGFFFQQSDGNFVTSHSNAVPTGFFSTYQYGGAVAGYISGISAGAGVQYISASDYRLKEDIAPMTGALETVAKLKPVTYTWKANGTKADGFIAHELQEVLPNAVSGEKDEVNEDGSIKPQGIDTSYIVATLTAAIQEQQAIIKQLQADVAALKAK